MSLTQRLPRWVGGRSPWDWIPPVLAAAGALAVVALAYGVFADRPVMEADLSTYLLPGRALLDGGGSLYVDFFDIKPPLTYALLVPWLAVVGPSLIGWWALYAILLAAVFTAVWLLLRSILRPWLALAVYASMSIVMVGASVLEELFFITEVMGLVLVLWGLVIAARSRPAALLAGAVLVTAAGQVKEVFILAPLALVPLALACPRGRIRGLAWAAGGAFISLAATLLVLVAWGEGVVAAYVEVLALKRDRFPSPGVSTLAHRSVDYAVEIVAWLPLLAVFVLALVLTAVLHGRHRRQGGAGVEAGVTGWTPRHSALVILLAAMAAGFVWQGAPLIRHYAVALIPPLFLALGAGLGWAWPVARSLPRWPSRILPALLLIGLLPAVSSVLWAAGSVRGYSPGRLVAAMGTLESEQSLARFQRIADATTADECIQVAYGWSASAYHWYSEREPCARFYVPPLDLSPALRREYQQTLIERPPSLIVYDPALVLSTTVPAEEGTPDEVVFPFAAVVEDCYEPLEADPLLFRPRQDLDVTSACISRQVEKEIRTPLVS